MRYNIVEGIHFEYITPDIPSEYVDIIITKGEYSGVIYRYGNIYLDENSYLNFQFKVIENNGFENLDNNESFIGYIGEILHSIKENESKPQGQVFNTLEWEDEGNLCE